MKKFVAPLQAFAALLICSGMAWMVFVLASINPVPPTANDLQARNTQDLSFANMNSTAVALAKQMLANMAPSPSGRILLPVTNHGTATPGFGAAVTLKPVDTFVTTPTSHSITLTPTREKPNDPVSTVMPTLAPTRTLRPATATNSASTKHPTQTPVSPTARPATATNKPTEIVPSGTPVPPPTEGKPTATSGSYP